MSYLGLVVVLFVMLGLHLFFRRGALKLNDSLLSSAVESSERYIIFGLTVTGGAFLVIPRVPWLQGSAAVFAGILLGLLLAHRYVARAEKQLGLQQQIGPPFVARFGMWSMSWWVLLLACIAFLVFGLPRVTSVLYTEAALLGGGAVLAEGVYARAWLRSRRS